MEDFFTSGSTSSSLIFKVYARFQKQSKAINGDFILREGKRFLLLFFLFFPSFNERPCQQLP